MRARGTRTHDWRMRLVLRTRRSSTRGGRRSVDGPVQSCMQIWEVEDDYGAALRTKVWIIGFTKDARGECGWDRDRDGTWRWDGRACNDSGIAYHRADGVRLGGNESRVGSQLPYERERRGWGA